LKLLIFGDTFSRHTIRLAWKLIKSARFSKIGAISRPSAEKFYPGEEISKLPYSQLYSLRTVEKTFLPSKVNTLLHLLKTKPKVKEIVKGYDVINIQAVTPESGILFSGLKKPIVSSFWGGEIWENLGTIKRFFQGLLLKNSILITVISRTMAEKVKEEFPFVSDNKLRFVRYGFLDPEILDNVSVNIQEEFKRRLGIKSHEAVVTVSYASAPRHRQDFILDSLEYLDDGFLKANNVKFVLPLTYGDPEWRNYIIKKVLRHKFRERIKVIDKMLPDNEVAVLRKISDVFINIPTQDTFSASMLEHLYVGSVVIVGSWLPYDELFNSEAFIIKIQEPSEKALISTIKTSILNLNDYRNRTKKNKDLAVKIGQRDNWVEIFEEAIEIWEKEQK